ncbi:hypothetical protein ACLOJK_032723 [Asimina triloba]
MERCHEFVWPLWCKAKAPRPPEQHVIDCMTKARDMGKEPADASKPRASLHSCGGGRRVSGLFWSVIFTGCSYDCSSHFSSPPLDKLNWVGGKCFCIYLQSASSVALLPFHRYNLHRLVSPAGSDSMNVLNAFGRRELTGLYGVEIEGGGCMTTYSALFAGKGCEGATKDKTSDDLQDTKGQ